MNKEKKLRNQLSDSELEEVSGGLILNRASKQEFCDQQPLPADPEPLTRFPTVKQIGMGTIPAATQDREIFEKLGILPATEFDIPDSN